MKKLPSITPIGSRIFFEDLQKIVIKKERVEGGIILPDNVKLEVAQKAYLTLTALAVGPDCKIVKRGDQVVIHPNFLESIVVAGVAMRRTHEHHAEAVVSVDSPKKTNR